MVIQNNSIVTDANTELLDSQISQISNDFAETYYFDNEQSEELEMLVAKAMKLGELYERKKWQTAKDQVVPEVTSVGNELQSWVAVWSFKARHDREDYIVVDANLLAEKIENLTGANA